MKRLTCRRLGTPHQLARRASLFRETPVPRQPILPLWTRTSASDRMERITLRVAVAMFGLPAVQIAVAVWRGLL